jgi:hypothetical protein
MRGAGEYGELTAELAMGMPTDPIGELNIQG